jgi:hypothetical protein
MPSGVSISETDATFSPSTEIAGIYAMLLKTERGPLKATKINSWPEFQRVYGGLLTTEYGPLHAKRALDGGARLAIVRLVHYSDPADASSTAAAQAYISLNDRQAGATYPRLRTTQAGPFNLISVIGGHFIFDRNGSSGPDRTLQGTQASVESGSAENYAGLPGTTLTFKAGKVNYPEQSISFVNGDFANPAAPTAEEVAAKLNTMLYGSAVPSSAGSKVTLVSDFYGTDSRIIVTGGTANAILNFPTTTNSGNGSAKDLAQMSTDELVAWITAAGESTLTPSNIDGKLDVQYTGASGASAYLGVLATSTVAVALGFTEGSGGRAYGTNSATSPTLKVLGKYAGTYAAGWTVQVTTSNTDAADQFTLVLPAQRGVANAERWANLSMDPSSARYALTIVNSQTNGSAYIALADLISTGSTLAAKRPAIGTYTLAGGNDGLAGFDEADILGDSSAGTGVHALGEIAGTECQDMILPYEVSNATAASLLAWAEDRQDMLVHLFRELQTAADVQDIEDYRRGQAAHSGTNFDSSYGCLYAGTVQVTDPITKGTLYIFPAGDLAASLNLCDTGKGKLDVRDYGPHFSPAGVKGQMIVDGIPYDLGPSGKRAQLRQLSDDNHVNTVLRQDGYVTFGDAFTLRRDGTTAFQWTSVRRILIYLEQRIITVIRKKIYEPNRPALWRAVAREVEKFLTTLKRQDWIESARFDIDQNAASMEQARLQTADSIERGEVNAELYISPYRPAREFKIRFIVTSSAAEVGEE